MNKGEVESILGETLAMYRSRPYAELAAWVSEGRIDIPQMVGPGGTHYNVEVCFFWDDKPNGCVRVMASAGKGLRVFFPVTESFILSPDGRFIDE